MLHKTDRRVCIPYLNMKQGAFRLTQNTFFEFRKRSRLIVRRYGVINSKS